MFARHGFAVTAVDFAADAVRDMQVLNGGGVIDHESGLPGVSLDGPDGHVEVGTRERRRESDAREGSGVLVAKKVLYKHLVDRSIEREPVRTPFNRDEV